MATPKDYVRAAGRVVCVVEGLPPTVRVVTNLSGLKPAERDEAYKILFGE